MPGPASGPSAFDEIAAFAVGTGPRCNAGPFIAGLSAEDQDAITRAIEAGYPMSAIGKFCMKRGFRFTEAAVVRHLAKRCSCPR